MTARYRFVKMPKGIMKEGTESVYYTRLVDAETITFSQIYERIHDGTSFTVADCLGVISEIEYQLLFHLLDGKKVHWEGIGTFCIKLGSEPVSSPNEIRAESIWGETVTFRPDKRLKDKIRHIDVRSAGPYREIKKLEEWQRWENVVFFIKNYSETITTRQYMGLNNCSKRAALADLKKFRGEGKLRLVKNTYFYVLNTEE